ncbi:MAG TPA: PQQ-binding-like beta-propeller repeat protein [Leptospiraceae bacterium]|nr:PQQ-binding-like beta-propeller repeat protein [Leptospiraceae bacterium]HMY66065.1 PQQ-binding-like beta-propeller repeat protein [Leptospiraceae bacterium]HNF26010.1 PQQ-binding-like beta-propeller repeat protein [Leptospiraceae bacterium]HNH08307.1 PQQ-binding-like beta-propeller repeat protein [Leptospiraceae bacterium]HNI98550.1 PQQ-binding-like beta-propeller repeat protein [Leptospiraceae bacterium]
MKYIRFNILISICTLLILSFCGEESGRNPVKETQILKHLLGSSHSVQNDSGRPETSESVKSKSSENIPAYDKKEDSPSIDCTDLKCSFPFRKDYREFLQMKYDHQREIHYDSDADGYYYLRFNPSAKSSNRFDLKTRVTFKTLRAAGIRYSLLIDEENQSSSVVARKEKGKTVWTHLLSSVPTLSPMRSGNQIFICTQDGKITSLNMHTGIQNWFFMTPGAVLIRPAAYNHFIIIFDDSGNIFWLDKNTGSLRHKYFLEEMPVISPVLKEGILVLSTPRGYIHGIKAMEAFPAWRDHSLMGRIEALYDSDDGFVLEGSSIVLFNFQTGAKQKFLNEEELRILAKKTPEFLRSPRMLRYAVEREKFNFSVSGL